MKKEIKKVELFTDGACSGNPGPGGWAYLLRYKDKEKTESGGETETTNNKMELTAVIKGLQALKESCHVHLFSDSQYVLKGLKEWIANWKKNNWKTASKKEVLNKDFWIKLDKLTEKHRISFHWVKGHAGHPENEQVDTLACLKRDEFSAKKLLHK